MSRHAAPEAAPPRPVVGARSRTGRERALLPLSLACGALLVAAPLAIVLSSTAPEAAGGRPDVARTHVVPTTPPDGPAPADVRDADPAPLLPSQPRTSPILILPSKPAPAPAPEPPAPG